MSPGLDDRARTVASVLAKADESLIRTRPQLVRAKYDLMRSSLYSFYRGTYPLYLHDAEQGYVLRTQFPVEGLLPLGIGDAHPENFGSMRALDGTFAIEPNDFDSADHTPYLWELRRLVIGMVVATRSSNPDDADALAAARASEKEIARAVAAAYAKGIVELAKHAADAPGRLTEDAAIDPNPVIADIFKRSKKDEASRSELDVETVVDAATGKRRLVRGIFGDDDPTDLLVPKKAFEDVPKSVVDALPDTLVRYRASLVAPPPASYFRVLDAAREFGAGVASMARIRMAILVEGPTSSPDDDVILELKELGDSGAGGFTRPDVPAGDPGDRVTSISRTLWAVPDAEPLWGASTLLGLDVQIKGEFDAYKGVKVKRLVDARGTPEALMALSTTLGGLLARMHAKGSDASTLAAIAEAVGAHPDAFAEEQATVGVAYADVVEGDYARFAKALDALGPRLGVPYDPSDAPTPDQAALIGVSPDEGTLP